MKVFLGRITIRLSNLFLTWIIFYQPMFAFQQRSVFQLEKEFNQFPRFYCTSSKIYSTIQVNLKICKWYVRVLAVLLESMTSVTCQTEATKNYLLL